jgi:predicted tellurium resistance membrane protein TerC
LLTTVTVPLWAWLGFAGFVVAMLVLDLFVLHRRAREVSLTEAGVWTAVWVVIGLGFGGLLWAWAGGGTAQAYLAGYLIEKSLSLDNVFVFAVIFSAFAIPARYQHRVLMLGIVGALIMRAGFIIGGVTLLEAFHPAAYLFGALLLVAAARMLVAGAAARFRYLQPGLAVILAAVAVKLLTADVYELPVWASPAFIAAVLAAVAAASVWDTHHRGSGRSGPGSQDQTRPDGKPRTGAVSGTAS